MFPKKKKIIKTDFSIAIGKRLKAVRAALKYTAPEMSSHLNVSIWTYRQNECGSHIPQIWTLERLLVRFNVSTNWMLTGKGQMFLNTKTKPDTVTIPDTDVREMVYLMGSVPLVHHSLIAHYKKLKKENRDFIKEELEKNEAADPKKVEL